MNAGAKYGVFLATVIFVLNRLVPQPAASVALWTWLTVEGAVIIWRRLHLRWFLLGRIALLIASSAMIAVSARGLDMVTMIGVLPTPIVAAIWACLLFIPLSIGLEGLKNTKEWRAWKKRAEESDLLDMLMYRHVPDLRPHANP